MSFYLDTHLSDRAYMIGEIGIDEVNEIKALKKRLSTSYFIIIKKSHKLICVIFIVE